MKSHARKLRNHERVKQRRLERRDAAAAVALLRQRTCSVDLADSAWGTVTGWAICNGAGEVIASGVGGPLPTVQIDDVLNYTIEFEE